MQSTIRRLVPLLALALIAAVPAAAQDQELPLGSDMPLAGETFTQAGGGQATLGSLAGDQGLVLVFWSNNCPWVDKYEARMIDLAETYAGRGFGFALVNPNDPDAFPRESLDASAQRADGYPVPYLQDDGARLARALGAERTPHVFVFDAGGALAYVGSLDDSPGDPGNVQNRYLADALDALAAGEPVATGRTKAFGCTIKF